MMTMWQTLLEVAGLRDGERSVRFADAPRRQQVLWLTAVVLVAVALIVAWKLLV